MEEACCGRMLRRPTTVREVAARKHERRVDPLDEVGNRSLDLGLMERPPRSDMQVRDVKDAC